MLPTLALSAVLTVTLAACGAGSLPADGDRKGSVDGTTPIAATPDAPAAGSATPVVPTPDTTTDAPAAGSSTPIVPTPDATTDTPATDVPATDTPAPDTPTPNGPMPSSPDIDPHGGEEAEAGTRTEAGAGASADADIGGGVAAAPVGCDAPSAEIQARALELINAARAEARACGERGDFEAAGTLGWDSRLEAAARTHSTDMAATGNFDHTGTDGSSAGDRIERSGYQWGEYAENIAAGQTSLEATVAGWLDSPGHCRNLMAPGVSDVAVACVSNEDARFRRYWTNVLARPFESRERP